MDGNYRRVIPRDLFNEANLLKCYGQIYIRAEHEEETAVELEHDGEPFEIVMDAADGSLSIANVQVAVNHQYVTISRPLNSREPWPIYAEYEGTTVSVFDQNGMFTEEFLNLGKEA